MREHAWTWRGRLFRGALYLMTLAFAAVCVGILLVAVYLGQTVCPHIDEQLLNAPMPAGASHIYYYDFEDRTARTGVRRELPDGVLDGGVHAVSVSYAELPEDLINAFVAIEDKRFWEHRGVDVKRTLGAATNYALGFTGRFGGSTITQQLVKNLTGKNEVTAKRKLQEICWAKELENKWTKQEILERYLNVINLSQGCYGVGAAADRFFGKSVDQLTLSECATVAGITQNPSYYDPVRFPEHTVERRNVILAQMLEQGYLDEATYREAVKEPLMLKEGAGKGKTPVYSWYVDMVVEDVIRDLCATYGYTREAANRLLWTGGLTIEAALDPTVQARLERYYADTAHFPVHKNGQRAQSAMIVIHPETGDVLGVVGAVGQKTGNRLQSFATDTLRPAASAIKPLSVYAPALQRGLITWGSVFDDVPVRFHTGASGGQTVAWPKNANRVYRGLTDVRYAVAHSVNTVAVRVLDRLGEQASFDFLHDTLGMSHLIAARTLEDGRRISDCGEAALALGQMNYGVTLRELTAGYTALAGGGVYVEPRSYFRVLGPDGAVLLDKPVTPRAALSEQNACIMTKLLQSVVEQGTAKGARLFGGRVEVAGKTGTSNADCDRYFIGYTPELLAGVWYGFEYPEPLSDIKSNQAVRIWQAVMTDLVRPTLGRAKKTFPMAKGIVKLSYCQDSGGIPTEACRMDARGDRCAEGYFVQGSGPKKYCDCHTLREYDVQRGVLADATTPLEARQRVGLIRVKRSFPRRVYVLDERYAVTS